MSVRIHAASFVDSKAKLGVDVEIGPGTVVGPNVVVGDRCVIESCVRLGGWTSLGTGCRVSHGAALGGPPQDLKYRGGAPSYLEFGERTILREFVTANLATEPEAATRVGSDCLLMAYSHVAHDCSLGNHVVVANAVQFAGYVTVEDWAIVGGATVVHQFVRIGCHAMVGGGSRISQDVAPYIKCAGSPPRLAGVNAIGLERRGIPESTRRAVDRAYRLLFREGLTIAEATPRMRSEFPGIAEVEHLARFAETSVRGLTR
jgi:UDP-N-acetylglucosamine acyltransferase